MKRKELEKKLRKAGCYLTPFLPENHLEMITEWQGFHPVFHR